MDAFDASNVEELFKELDEQQFVDVAKSLAAYRGSLMKEGFTRRESMRLVEAYSKFLYDITLENFLSEKRQEEYEALDSEEEEAFEPVDDFEDEDDD